MTTPCKCCGHVLTARLKPTTPDTSSDDATLAAAEALMKDYAYMGAKDVRAVVAIARRLQGEVREERRKRKNEANRAHASEDAYWGSRQRAEKAEAVVRELRATIARVLAEADAHDKLAVAFAYDSDAKATHELAARGIRNAIIGVLGLTSPASDAAPKETTYEGFCPKCNLREVKISARYPYCANCGTPLQKYSESNFQA